MSTAFPARPREANTPSLSNAIVASMFTETYTQALVDNACRELAALEPDSSTMLIWAPGSFEIPLFAQSAAEMKRFHAIITFGVILQGETGHATLIAEAVTRSLLDISLKHRMPVIHEVLLLKDEAQAKARCIEIEHNRGIEAARAAVLAARTLSEIA
jgi:6,7-dimethyl-8-ribityllumazine synthase